MPFERVLEVDVPVAVLWAFHERPDALELLRPPWERMEVVQPPRSLEVGTRVILKAYIGPVPMTIVSEHVAYEKERLFADRMLRGPFKSFVHEHRFTDLGPSASRLVDAIDFELPGGALGRKFGGPVALARLDKLFAYRHKVTKERCTDRGSG